MLLVFKKKARNRYFYVDSLFPFLQQNLNAVIQLNVETVFSNNVSLIVGISLRFDLVEPTLIPRLKLQ